MRKTPIKQKKTNPMLKNIKINTTTKSLVLIDQKPIRKSYIKDCQKVIKKIDSLKLQIQHFEKADKPAYGNWINTQFGDEILYKKTADYLIFNSIKLMLNCFYIFLIYELVLFYYEH